MELSNQELDVAVKLINSDRRVTKNSKRPTYSQKTKQLCVNLSQEPKYKSKLNAVLGSGTLDYWLKTIKPTIATEQVEEIEVEKLSSNDINSSKFNKLRKNLADQIYQLNRQIELLHLLEQNGYQFPEDM